MFNNWFNCTKKLPRGKPGKKVKCQIGSYFPSAKKEYEANSVKRKEGNRDRES